MKNKISRIIIKIYYVYYNGSTTGTPPDRPDRADADAENVFFIRRKGEKFRIVGINIIGIELI